MKKVFFLGLISLMLWSCSFETPTQFSEAAANEQVFSLANEALTLKEVLGQYKGKKVLIDVWASWCADCIRGLPNVAKLQREFPEVVFLFLSVDTHREAWKKGIQRFQIDGEHYNLPKGMSDGDFVDFVGLSWIPRYLLIDEEGGIALFKATSASDKRIPQALRKIQ